MTARIALIHATRAAIPPIELAFYEIWPEAEYWNLLDEGLNQILEGAGELTEEIHERFVRLATYAADTRIDGVLFTCTAFGAAMEECQKRFVFPTLKPNEAMFEIGIESGPHIGLLATHPVTLSMLEAQLELLAQNRGLDITIETQLAPGDWEALTNGNQKTHDNSVIDTAHLLGACDVILLAQFSMAHLAQTIPCALISKVVSSPGAAVRKLRKLLNCS